MPDWSYNTVLRPILFRLSPTASRDFSLGLMGKLAGTPVGPVLIDLLGHMAPSGQLAREVEDVQILTPVGLGNGLDINGVALKALARFGFGFLEIGPVTPEPILSPQKITRLTEQQAILYPDPLPNPGAERLAKRIPQQLPHGLPLWIGLGYAPDSTSEQVSQDCQHVIGKLAPFADLFALWTTSLAEERNWSSDEWKNHLQCIRQAIDEVARPRGLLLAIAPDLSPESVQRWINPALEMGVISGISLAGGISHESGQRVWGLPAYESTLKQVNFIRAQYGRDLLVIVGGGSGIHDPIQAMEAIYTGANAVQIDTGLIYSGPGLPKRCNEAILYHETNSQKKAVDAAHFLSQHAPKKSWFWTMLMGISMLLGGVIAMMIATTRVVLPYDESISHMTRAELQEANPRLLDFMKHDRVTLAGTMLTIGTLYVLLSWFGLRRGQHWAYVTVVCSAFPGFFSFFLFLGFGYFDPFHAFVTAILFQFLLFTLHAPLAESVIENPPNLRRNRRWHAANWGQLIFVIQGVVVIAAGIVICTVGITSVFVKEDLEFMQTTAHHLRSHHPNLVPLVAHDRATFGGMLLSSGIAVLLASLWGFRQGHSWLWWMLLLSGCVGYVPTILVHWEVGYTSLWHLLPAYLGLGAHLLASALSWSFLCGRDSELEKDWQRFRSSP